MSSFSLRIVLATFGLLCVSVTTAALADEEPIADARAVSVKSRARPGYDALGIRAGSFLVFPSLTVGERYSDNIYATDTNTIDDFVTSISGKIDVNSQWSRHALSFKAGISQDLFAKNSDENRLNWNVGIDGRIDVVRDTQIMLGGSFQHLHEDRGDPNAVAAAKEPTEYTLTMANAGFNQRFNRITASAGITYSKYDYKDVQSIIGTIIDQDDRDRQEYVENLRLGYDISPDTNVYVEGRLNQRDYRLQPPATAFDRNSDGYSAVVGSDFKLSSLMQGGFFVGYQEQEYDSPAFSSISGISYGANVDWFLTPLTTVSLSGASTIEETTSAGASGYLHSSVGLNIDHELLRNVIISGRASYANDNYEGNPRKDDIIGAGVGISYLLNRNFSVGLDYDLTNRNSNISGVDYNRNQVGLTLTGKL